MIDLTKAEYDTVGEHMMDGKRYVKFDKGILRLDEIRAIVLMPEIEEPEQTEDGQPSVHPEYGAYDEATLEWLKANGVDIVNGGMLE
jgi:hypothetical protein